MGGATTTELDSRISLFYEANPGIERIMYGKYVIEPNGGDGVPLIHPPNKLYILGRIGETGRPHLFFIPSDIGQVNASLLLASIFDANNVNYGEHPSREHTAIAIERAVEFANDTIAKLKR